MWGCCYSLPETVSLSTRGLCRCKCQALSTPRAPFPIQCTLLGRLWLMPQPHQSGRFLSAGSRSPVTRVELASNTISLVVVTLLYSPNLMLLSTISRSLSYGSLCVYRRDRARLLFKSYFSTIRRLQEKWIPILSTWIHY